MDESEADLSLCETYYDDDSTNNFGDDQEMNINWRGWKRFEHAKQLHDSLARERPQILPLVELAAKTIAYHIPFEIVENVRPPVPEQLHLRITYWSFPESEDEIRLYACLANGNSIEYDKAENIIKNYGVKNLLQIGFYISATVRDMVSHTMTSFEVSLTFDRRRIVSCTCTCASSSVMCCHIVAVCLSRILHSNRTELRPPVSESLLKLKKDQLRKFAQYLITKLPQQILPTAQHILDDLLNKESEINHSPGAPDPTSGPAAFEKTSWCLDLLPVLEGIRKTLVKLKTVPPEIHPPAETVTQNQQQLPIEFSSFLKPLRGKEPEGMWNLISIIKHLMKKGDENSVVLLKTLTEEVMDCDYVIYWWFTSKTKTRNPNYNNNFLIIASNMNTSSTKNQVTNFAAQSMQGSSHMCDEIVHLWRLTVLNPKLSARNKEDFYGLIENWHIKVMRTIFEKFREEDNILNDLDKHPGFKAALKACLMDWTDYPIAGLTDDSANNFELFLDTNLSRSSSKLAKLKHYLRSKSKENKPPNSQPVDADAEAKKGDHQKAEQGEMKITVYPHSTSNDAKPKDSLDDELNFLYKYDVTVNNYLGVDCKRLHPVNPQQQQFTYTLSTKKDDDPIEIMFARAEALYAHGQDRYAIDLVVYLANHILDNPPKIDVELNPPAPPAAPNTSGSTSNGSVSSCPNGTSSTNSSTNTPSADAATSSTNKEGIKESRESKESKGKKTRSKNSLINANMYVSEIYTKITFLMNVLISNQVRLDLAFRIGLLGLELARPPAIIKALEVKLYFQEQELIPLLKRIPLHKPEMELLRERGRAIRDGKLVARGSLLPLSLASFIFDAFVLSKSEEQKSSLIVKHRLPVDDYIGFECAVAAIGLKCPFTEKDHQFLWESIKRQRFDFILNVICHYKEKENHLVRIMEKLIEKEGSGPHHCDQDRKGTHFKHKHQYRYPAKPLSTAGGCPADAELSSFAEELIEYERKYAKCNCSLKDLNSKLITASSPNYSHIQCLLQQPKNKFKDKNKLTQSVGKSVGHMNVQFMQDLGKQLLNRAGCNISDNFDGNNLGRPIAKPNKNLHYCGFLCLLYALGLNNQLIKWLQRTYSILVSFVLKEASEIGYPAIKCLITTWKGYLTPNEAISISTQAVSRPNESSLLNAKAKLALSVLSESQALRLIDIRLALQLCKDQSEDMHFQALEEIEKSYKNGGLSSDILFETAQAWYNIYLEYSTKDPSKLNLNSKKKLIGQHQNGQSDRCATQASPIYPFPGMDYGLNGFGGPLANNQQPPFGRLHSQLIMPPPPAHFNFPPPPPPPAIYYPHPAAFIYPPNQVNGLPGHFQIPPPPPNFSANLAAMNFNLHHMLPPPPPQQMFAAKNFQISNGLHPGSSATLPNQPFGGKAQLNHLNGSRHLKGANQAPPMLPNIFGHLQAANQQPISHYQASVQLINQIKQKAYHKAYSLGIMALDALPKKGSDDRSAAAKYDLHPQYYDEILWLAEISTKLSPVAHQEFLNYVSRQIPSPTILFEIVLIFAKIIDPLPQNHQSKQSFHKFVQNTQYAFEQCIRYKLAHSVDQDELEKLFEKAKVVYSKLPNGVDILMKKMETLKLNCSEKDRQNLEKILNSKIKRNFDSAHHSNHHHDHHHHSTNGHHPSSGT